VIVVDTQVVVYWAVRGPASPLVDAILERDAGWTAPALWQSEFRNVLAGMLRRGELDIDQASERFRRASEIVVSRAVDSELIIQLITQSPCTAYDLEFVALAQQLEVPLITNDRQIIESFPATAVAAADFGRA
jgi:predicted nucleic acid-binding protein